MRSWLCPWCSPINKVKWSNVWRAGWPECWTIPSHPPIWKCFIQEITHYKTPVGSAPSCWKIIMSDGYSALNLYHQGKTLCSPCIFTTGLLKCIAYNFIQPEALLFYIATKIWTFYYHCFSFSKQWYLKNSFSNQFCFHVHFLCEKVRYSYMQKKIITITLILPQCRMFV